MKYKHDGKIDVDANMDWQDIEIMIHLKEEERQLALLNEIEIDFGVVHARIEEVLEENHNPSRMNIRLKYLADQLKKTLSEFIDERTPPSLK